MFDAPSQGHEEIEKMVSELEAGPRPLAWASVGQPALSKKMARSRS